MSEEHVLRWPEGDGWLVLSGGSDRLGEVRSLALSRITPHGGVAYISLDEETAEDILEDLGELGAPTGYLIDVVREDDDTIREKLEDASLIVIPGDSDAPALRSVLLGVALEGIAAAYGRGTVILAEGPAASLFGKFVLDDYSASLEGFHWLENTFVVPSITSIAESQQAREMLASGAVGVAIGIGVGSALALGPGGQVETWGQAEVTIALGSGVSS